MWTPMLYRSLLRHSRQIAAIPTSWAVVPRPSFAPTAAFSAAAADGTPVRGFLWRHDHPEPGRPVVIINPATAVRCRYYFRFADYLFRNGMDVVTYDYRGIGESRPGSLRGFAAGWRDWGAYDFEAILTCVSRQFPGQPVDVVAHSIGGVLIGLAPSNGAIRRIFSVGAQYAHWRDYASELWVPMILRWHVVMPLLTAIFGYFPGKRLGWLEDVPAGVVRDWSRMGRHFDHSLSRGDAASAEAIRRQFAAVTAPILAVGASDDPFGTPVAIDRMLDCFPAAKKHHRRLDPARTGHPDIGHFAFFHGRFEDTLWPIALDWLQEERLPAP